MECEEKTMRLPEFDMDLHYMRPCKILINGQDFTAGCLSVRVDHPSVCDIPEVTLTYHAGSVKLHGEALVGTVERKVYKDRNRKYPRLFKKYWKNCRQKSEKCGNQDEEKPFSKLNLIICALLSFMLGVIFHFLVIGR